VWVRVRGGVRVRVSEKRPLKAVPGVGWPWSDETWRKVSTWAASWRDGHGLSMVGCSSDVAESVGLGSLWLEINLGGLWL
tara:strand:- start:302 stop:541 length:240 start_codon:yes stop_codon:yes gene_type:complete